MNFYQKFNFLPFSTKVTFISVLGANQFMTRTITRLQNNFWHRSVSVQFWPKLFKTLTNFYPHQDLDQTHYRPKPFFQVHFRPRPLFHTNFDFNQFLARTNFEPNLVLGETGSLKVSSPKLVFCQKFWNPSSTQNPFWTNQLLTQTNFWLKSIFDPDQFSETNIGPEVLVQNPLIMDYYGPKL